MMNLSDLIKGFDKLSCTDKDEIKKHIKLDWKHILPNLKLPEHILEIFIDQMDINDVIKYQNVSQEFITKYKSRYMSE